MIKKKWLFLSDCDPKCQLSYLSNNAAFFNPSKMFTHVFIQRISIPEKSLIHSIFEHLVQQNFIIFILIELLWFLNGKFLMPLITMCIQVPFHLTDMFVELWKIRQLKKSLKRAIISLRVKRDGKWKQIDSTDVQTSDLLSICNLLLKLFGVSRLYVKFFQKGST